MFVTKFILISVLIGAIVCQPMSLINRQWMDKYKMRSYEHRLPVIKNEMSLDEQAALNFGYSEQGMKDLDEVGDLVGGGDSSILALLRPYYSMVDMSATGTQRGIGSYLHVLPDEEYGDKPIYSLGGSVSGGIEPPGVKHGYLSRPFG